MPGAIINASCAACGARHELRVGHGLGWAFEQHVCHGCRTIRSIAVAEELVTGPCPGCGVQLERWTGSATFDAVAGPCPACLEVAPWRVEHAERWE